MHSHYYTGIRAHLQGFPIIPNWSCVFYTNSPPFLTQPPVNTIWLFLALLIVDALLLCRDTLFNLPIHLLAIIFMMNNAVVSISIQMSEPWLSIFLGTLLRDGLAGLRANSIFNFFLNGKLLCYVPVWGDSGTRLLVRWRVPFFYFLIVTCHFLSSTSSFYC